MPGNVLILAAFLAGMFGSGAWAQIIGVQKAAPYAPSQTIDDENTQDRSSDAIVQQASGQQADQQVGGRIHGTVMDPNGDVLPGARVKLEAGSSQTQQTQVTDTAGAFDFSPVPPGNYRLTISSQGFVDWAEPEITLQPGKDYEVAGIVLKLPSAHTDVVVMPIHELAELQIKAEEKQRVIGAFPNFYASYVWRAAPLSAGQKFRLAIRTSVDPVTFLTDAAVAGIQQSQNAFSGYGQGAAGYAKRFGAAYADDAIGTMVGGAILPSLLHQDPRYFYKGTGSIGSRALYAISTVVICRGDNGRWQPNYSNILGTMASAGISNLYYPSTDRNGAGVTIGNALIGLAEGAFGGLLQEFVYKKISRGVAATTSIQASGTRP